MAVVGALVAVTAAAWFSARAQGYAFRMSVGSATTGPPIPRDFLGLAVEFNTVPKLAGATPATVNPVFVQLLRNLDPTGQPIIRVGGQSTDRTWWPVRGMTRPYGVTYNLWPGWTAAARSLAQATKARLILGVNLEANRLRISQVEGSELVRGVGRGNIEALEIGNEPDLYPLLPWYRQLNSKPIAWYSKSGGPVYSRRPTYGPQEFAQEFSRTVRVLPRLAIAGPETGSTPWMSAFTGFLSPRSQVSMLTSHAYGLDQCITDPTSLQYPSVPNLLNTANSRGLAAGVGPYVSLVHRDGGTYRIDEMGSVSCNGRPGVSNTFASALWLMDSLFEIASQGIDGVNLHTYPNSANGLFDFTRSRGHWAAVVHPIYYGALMFEQAAPAGSRPLRITSGSQSRLRAWATLGPDRRIRVLLINDNVRSSAQTHVRVAGGVGAGAVERLGAPSPYATAGISVGGASFGAETATGVLPTPVPEAVTASAGAYTVTLPAGSAALLTVSRRRG
ncbi:MAG TPA: glycosyl hydrolase family 79 C-terminal domain-containing protein [Solirubrobacteraceae bacterium]|nr:glycosyl hydrolase family 79 C-terminal domain-containing protein [Solirubrobacteraceae bacterium]